MKNNSDLDDKRVTFSAAIGVKITCEPKADPTKVKACKCHAVMNLTEEQLRKIGGSDHIDLIRNDLLSKI